MRYYSINITDPKTGATIPAKGLESLKLPATFTSYVNGQTIPGALRVEIDASVFDYSLPIAEAFIRVWGITIEQIGQASKLAGMNIEVSAGMQKGLPLANSAQSGPILKGWINKAFGNWIGSDMTLDLRVVAGVSPLGLGSPKAPVNLTHNWAKGTPLSDAIKTTLTTAFPGYTANININPKLILTENDPGYYHSITQYAQYIDQLSRNIIGGTYQGVKIISGDKSFTVYDGTTTPTPKQLNFQDLIGQPTWIDINQLSIKTVMRADIPVGGAITFPPKFPSQFSTTQDSGALPLGTPVRASSIFQGSFQVTSVRHVGDSRQPDAASWVSIFEVFPLPAST